MKVARTIAELREARRALAGVGLVPTMGALHAGHRSLVRAARGQSETVAVSIFVNPLQFGPREDFAAYPRTLSRDLEVLASEGVDLVFAPEPAELVRPGATTTIDPGALGTRLDGASRPGHFRGVCTIVAKLFHLVGPARAFFGQKDAAQLAVLRAMVRDLDLPVQLVACPTVREPDGLALSSRNQYLTPAERAEAPALFRALEAARAHAASGTLDADPLRQAMHASLARTPAFTVEYAEAVDPDTLEPLAAVDRGALLAIAARLGTTRLIDNVLLPPEPSR